MRGGLIDAANRQSSLRTSTLSVNATTFIPSATRTVNNSRTAVLPQIRAEKLEHYKLVVFYFNARSIRNKLNELYDVLYAHEYGIICITETWLTTDFADGLLDPEGKFAIYRKDRNDRDGGGVCILVHRSISSAPIDSNSIAYANVEIIGCRLQIGCRGESRSVIYSFCVYLPPNITTNDFMLALTYIRSMWSINNTGITIGDFNLPE